MTYSPITPKVLGTFSNVWFEPVQFMNLLNSLSMESFQTQAGRDKAREAIVACLVTVPTANLRFPSGVWYAYRDAPSIGPVFSALLQATDTKNRMAENSNDSAPAASVELRAMARTDDATVAIRNSIDNIRSVLVQGQGVLDRESYETSMGLAWAEAPTRSRPSTSSG